MNMDRARASGSSKSRIRTSTPSGVRRRTGGKWRKRCDSDGIFGHFSGQMAATASRMHENGHFVLLRIYIHGGQNMRFWAILARFRFYGRRRIVLASANRAG